MPQSLLRFLEDLSVIQGHVRGVVVIPNGLDDDDARMVAEVAELIRTGEVRASWDVLELNRVTTP